MIGLLLTVALAGPIDEGLVAWEAGDLDAAASVWESALDGRRGSVALHLNLGVARYRQGDLARAVAHWNMARAISPRDPDPAHNLAVVRAEIEGAPPPAPALPAALQLATVGEYGVLGSLALLIGSIAAWIARWRRHSLWPWLGLVAIGALLGAAGVSGLWALERHPGAVVVDRELALRVDPDPSAPVARRLPPGAELVVEREIRDFVLLRAGDGARGWAPRASVAIIGARLELPPAR